MPTFTILSDKQSCEPRSEKKTNHGQTVKIQNRIVYQVRERLVNVKVPSTKPRGRPPTGKMWCERTRKWVIGSLSLSPSLSPTPIPTASGSTKVISGKRVENRKRTFVVVKSVHDASKTEVKTRTKCLSKQNKFIHKQLMAGKMAGLEEALQEGGSLAYFNYDGICNVAEKGKIEIFKMIFEKLDYTRLIDKALCTDLCETALEEGHETLSIYLRSKFSNLKDAIENENLDGLDDFA